MFGRRDDEDPFGRLRTGTQAPLALPTAAAVPARADPERPSAALDALLLVLLVVLALGGSAYALVQRERAAIADPVLAGKRGEIVGADGRSLVRAPNFARSLRVAQSALHPGEQVVDLRLSPTALTVRARDVEGDARDISVGLDYRVHSTDDGTDSRTGPRDLSSVEADAPGRLLASVLARTHFAPRTLSSLTFTPARDGDDASWDAVFTGVAVERSHWVAGADGRSVAVSDTPPAPDALAASAQPGPTTSSSTTTSSTVTITIDGHAHHFSGARAARVSACMRAAGADVARMRRCVR